ncbi:hypothetical protein E0L93_12895 [Rubrobacter taiwanensis]|jgi:hypothetical protein|uniref:Exo-alpha-sialidase n=1 Tax=Rubrobacter taiwanensis TaxID=185139 RepID=A0A4R1BED5_9ACTN|nr:hypothetical protein [Rubrobacter taiwanensis]TCJ15479.1 hypothetical protein E0L93_12895 [Rubrobacter taiwanensis]
MSRRYRLPLPCVGLALAVIVALGVGTAAALMWQRADRSGEAGSESASATSTDDDVGYRDFSFSADGVTPAGYGPTGAKPQSKLWFNDGVWWSVLFNRAAEEYRIYRYNKYTRTWRDTGTVVDRRNRSMADTLWDGVYLYVVSATPDVDAGYGSAEFSRYSYDRSSRSYSLDAGFPVTITGGGMEAIVLAKDTTGKVWATYTRHGEVYVTHTLNSDLSWAKPFVLPVEGSTADPEDISAIIAFDGRIGVMWSNQLDDAFYFAIHKDGEPEDAWEASTALQGPGMANDHINLKADSDGRVYAAVKTRRDRVDRAPDAPETLLLVRDPGGDWTGHTFGRVSDDHTRPIVLLDEEHHSLYVFATAPRVTNGKHGGKIFYKVTSMDGISFEEGPGTPFIRRSTDPNVNDATSTKQNLSGTTGLMVAASDNVSGYYFHNFMDLKPVPDASANGK